MRSIDIKALKIEIESEAKQLITGEQLEEFRVKYLGRKGLLAKLTASIPTLPTEERASLGREVNDLKKRLQSIIEEKQSALAATISGAAAAAVDIGLPLIVRIRTIVTGVFELLARTTLIIAVTPLKYAHYTQGVFFANIQKQSGSLQIIHRKLFLNIGIFTVLIASGIPAETLRAVS